MPEPPSATTPPPGSAWHKRLHDLAQRPLLRNIAKVSGGNIAGNVLNLAVMLLLARILTQDDNGALSALMAAMLMIAQLADLGLNTTLLKYYREEKIEHGSLEHAEALMRHLFWLRLWVLGAMAAAACLLASPICGYMLKLPQYVNLFRIGCAGALANSLWMYAQVSMQSREQFTQYALQTFGNHLLRFLLIGYLWWHHNLGVESAFIVMIIVPLVGSAICMFSWPRLFWTAQIDPALLRERMHTIFHFSKWVFVSFIVVTINSYAGVLQVTALSDTKHAAIFAVPERLAQGVGLLTAAMGTVLFPRLVTTRSQAEISRILRIFLKVSPFLAVGTAVAWFAAYYLFPLILGTNYSPSVPVFGLLMTGQVITLVINPLSYFCYAFNKGHWIALMNVGQMIVYVVCNYFLIPHLGVLGPPIITLTKVVLTLGVVLWFTKMLHAKADKHA